MTAGTGSSERKLRAALPPGRQYSREYKRRAVEETFAAGMSVSIVARRHDINSNQLFTWRQQYYRGEFGDVGRRGAAREFIPVTIVDQHGSAAPVPAVKRLPSPHLPRCPADRQGALPRGGLVRDVLAITHSGAAGITVFLQNGGAPEAARIWPIIPTRAPQSSTIGGKIWRR
jgi:transposase